MSTLTVTDLTAGYGPREVLRDVTLEARAGELVALVGPNGAGKSTLIRAVSGVLSPRRGSVRVDGEDLWRLRPAERARRVAVVPQTVRLPAAFTVSEIVRLGRAPHLALWGREGRRDRAIAWEAMLRTEVDALAGRRVGELSGGERQRVTLARALTQEPRVLLLDEATAHLDLRHQVSILELVRSLARQHDLAVVATLHDLNQAALFADRIALLESGRLRACGPPARVLVPEILEPAYGVRVRVIADPTRPTPFILPEARDR